MASRPSQITESHLQRRAIAYLRQSTEEQIRHNVGSTALQRELPTLLQELGWPPSRIDVVDEDLGVSGSTSGLRQGFRGVVEAMRAGLVGAVAVTDSSRLTRNLEDLAAFATAAQQQNVLLLHGGQITDFRDPNSAFVGLIMGLNAARENQARADLSRRARRKKAENGISTTRPPVGYVAKTWAKDNDPRVRAVITLIFDKFLELGSAGGVLRYCRDNDIRLPRRGGHWAVADRWRIFLILKNAAYAGFYEFGKTAADPSLPPTAQGHRRQSRRPESEWIRIPNHHEHYIAPSLWEDIQRRIGENRNRLKAPPGRGEALVQGLLRCAVHKVTFRTSYPYRANAKDDKPKRLARYRCDAGDPTQRAKTCAAASAHFIDPLIEAELLRTLSPPNLGDLRQAAKEALRSHEGAVRLREDEVRRSEQGAAEAERTYDQADPDQPLFKQRLAQRAEDALERLEEVRARHRLRPLVAPVAIGHDELTELEQRLTDLAELWRHPLVTASQRKRIARTAIRTIHVTPSPAGWDMSIEWVGGARSSVTFYPWSGVCEALGRAYGEGLPPREIADRLNELGMVHQHGPAVGKALEEASVRGMVRRRELQKPFDDTAYPFIRQALEKGIMGPQIAQALNRLGIRHYLGSWTPVRVNGAMKRIREGRVPGVAPLARPERLDHRVRALHEVGLDAGSIAKQLWGEGRLTRHYRGPTTYTVFQILKRLGLRLRSDELAERNNTSLKNLAPGRSVREVTQLANAHGLRTRHGNPWSENEMARKLASAGLRESKKRGSRQQSPRIQASDACTTD